MGLRHLHGGQRRGRGFANGGYARVIAAVNAIGGRCEGIGLR
jgi:hypothetical protein